MNEGAMLNERVMSEQTTECRVGSTYVAQDHFQHLGHGRVLAP